MSIETQIKQIRHLQSERKICAEDAKKLIAAIPGGFESIERRRKKRETLVGRRIDSLNRVRGTLRSSSFAQFLTLYVGFKAPVEQHKLFDAIVAEVCYQLDVPSFKMLAYDRSAMIRWQALHREFVLWRDVPAKTNSVQESTFDEHGNFIPFWERDPSAIREQRTRITYRDYSDSERAMRLAKARKVVEQSKPSRALLIEAVRSRKVSI